MRIGNELRSYCNPCRRRFFSSVPANSAKSLPSQWLASAKKVIAVDSYDNAPAQQVTPHREMIDMLNGDELDRIVAKHKPDIIVPEIEAIRTERFYDYEATGIQVVPSAKAANFTIIAKRFATSLRKISASKPRPTDTRRATKS